MNQNTYNTKRNDLEAKLLHTFLTRNGIIIDNLLSPIDWSYVEQVLGNQGYRIESSAGYENTKYILYKVSVVDSISYDVEIDLRVNYEQEKK